MGKKSRRARARARAKAKVRAEQSTGGEIARSLPAERIYPAEPKFEPKPKVAMPSAEPALVPVQATRYEYVIPELRQIGIITGILFIVLIVLTFVLH